MKEGLLIPDSPYKYCFDEAIPAEHVARAVDTWCQAWSLLPDVVAQCCSPYLDSRNYESRGVVAFLHKDDPSIGSLAWSFLNGYVLLFKPEVLALFSDASAKALCGHELAHVYLKATGDDLHRIPPMTPAEKQECEDRADANARTWGFSIDACREEGRRLKVEHPEMFR